VSLALRRPVEISILNVLSGRVTSISGEDESTVDVELAIGTASLISRITRRSLHELGLHVGQEVFALVKAVSFNRGSVGYA